MVTRISTAAAAAALLLASPATAQSFTDFRGGGHVSNFRDCPDYDRMFPVTARARVSLSEGDISVSIFSQSFGVGWRDLGEPDGNGWQSAQQTGMFTTQFTNSAEIRILNVSPSDYDVDTEDFNAHFWVRGFPSIDPNCRVNVRVHMRAVE